VVRVTATITSPATFSTQSSNLTVTTGLPASGGFSIAVGSPQNPAYTTLACPNVEAASVDFFTVPVTVQLLDRYNNPVPDNTAVTFTTDGGAVTGSCETGVATTNVTTVAPPSGQCVVNWTSSNPFPTTTSTPPAFRNGRAQILATAIGEESFDDVASTGYYQAGDPFSDLGEPYLDADEQGSYKKGDPFDNYYNTGSYVVPSGSFIGITCTSTTCTEATLGIGVQHLMVMSTSTARAFMSVTSPYTTFTNLADVSVNAGSSGGFMLLITDGNGNAMAAGTTVAVATTGSAFTVAAGQGGTYTVGCNGSGGPGSSSPYTIPAGVIPQPLGGGNTAGGDAIPVTLTGTTAGSGSLTITVTSPETKSITQYGINVTVQPPSG